MGFQDTLRFRLTAYADQLSAASDDVLLQRYHVKCHATWSLAGGMAANALLTWFTGGAFSIISLTYGLRQTWIKLVKLSLLEQELQRRQLLIVDLGRVARAEAFAKGAAVSTVTTVVGVDIDAVKGVDALVQHMGDNIDKLCSQPGSSVVQNLDNFLRQAVDAARHLLLAQCDVTHGHLDPAITAAGQLGEACAILAVRSVECEVAERTTAKACEVLMSKCC